MEYEGNVDADDVLIKYHRHVEAAGRKGKKEKEPELHKRLQVTVNRAQLESPVSV